MVHGIPPFPGVRESLEYLHDKADILIVSATPREALLREWQEHDMLKYVHLLCAQEDGSKKECIQAVRDHYGPDHVLMIGDAPGDLAAARQNNALFYPILPGDELTSWQTFVKESMNRFLEGTYKGDYEQSLIRRFNDCLPEVPTWKR